MYINKAWHSLIFHGADGLPQKDGVKNKWQRKYIPVYEVPGKVSYLHSIVSMGWSS